MVFSGKKIRTPKQGLLAMHPFVDVLEGRDLFTATMHDGVVSIASVVEATRQPTASAWCQSEIATSNDAEIVVSAATVAADPVRLLAAQTTPGEYKLVDDAQPFCSKTIGDGNWSLFGNALHDRRGANYVQQPLPTDEQIAASRPDRTEGVFSNGRSLSGAMRPFLTMRTDQPKHPFASETYEVPAPWTEAA